MLQAARVPIGSVDARRPDKRDVTAAGHHIRITGKGSPRAPSSRCNALRPPFRRDASGIELEKGESIRNWRQLGSSWRQEGERPPGMTTDWNCYSIGGRVQGRTGARIPPAKERGRTIPAHSRRAARRWRPQHERKGADRQKRRTSATGDEGAPTSPLRPFLPPPPRIVERMEVQASGLPAEVNRAGNWTFSLLNLCRFFGHIDAPWPMKTERKYGRKQEALDLYTQETCYVTAVYLDSRASLSPNGFTLQA